MFYFPFKDLTRRKNQTILSILAFSLCVAVVVFFVVTSENLNANIQSVIEGRFDIWWTKIFSDFTNVVILLSIITVTSIVYFLTSINMSERRKDIGIMKSAGCLTQVVFGYFVTELFIIIFTSCVTGVGIGTFWSYIHIALNKTSLSESNIVINYGVLTIILLIFILVSLLFGIRPIVNAIQAKPAHALATRFPRGRSQIQPTKLMSKLGLSFKVAYRTLFRRRSATNLMIICLALVMTLSTMMVTGTTLVNETTQSYVKRAIGENVILIGHPDICTRYKNFLSQLFQTEDEREINYVDSKYSIPEALVLKLKRFQGVIRVDPRLVLETRVHEVQGITFVGEDKKRAVLLGDHRSVIALVQGVEPEHVVNEWLVWGRTLNGTDFNSVILGDSLNSRIISFPSEQKVRIQDMRFGIAGVALDPLNSGLVVYAPLNSISVLFNYSGYNVLLLRIDSSSYSNILNTIKTEIAGTGLDSVELNEIVSSYVDFFDFMWSPYIFLSLSFLGAIVFSLSSYLALNISEQELDLSIMRALGAKPRMVIKIVLIQALIITLVGGVIGIFAGSSIVFIFLIPDPVFSPSNLVLTFVWLISALFMFCVSGSYPAFKVLRRSVTSLSYNQ